MQNRRGAVNSGAINENLFKYNGRNYQSIENSGSSDEYEEEETHISYQFRRWANHICSVSNNVTNRLRDLLGNHPSSNTTSNHSVEESCSEDDSNAISWTTSSSIIESSNRIKNGDSDTRHHDEQKQNYRRINPGENYCRYGQNFYSHMTRGHLTRHATANGVEASPDFIMGQNVATYPPVLILPRLHQGVNRQPMDTSSYQSRKHVLRCQNMHRDQYADGWYQHYYHLGKRSGCEESRGGDNHSDLSDRRRIPAEKLSSVMNEPKIKSLRRKSPRTSREKRRFEPCDYQFESKKQCRTYVSDFHSESYRNGRDSASPIYDTRRSREKTFARSWIPRNYEDNDEHQNSNHGLESSRPDKAKKIVWDSQLSDITSQEPSSMNPSRPSVTLDMEEQKTLVDDENVEVPVKDDAKQQEIGPPADDVNAATNSQISHDIRAEEKSFEKQTDDPVNGNGIKWSSVTENSVDSLLQSLRERMDTLANVHLLDTGARSGSIESDRKKETSLTKECIVASCLAGTYLPQCLERENGMDFNSVAKKEEIRPSFSDRIQDIWRDGRARVWRSSPRHQTSSSRYNLKSEKDLQSKLSLLGLNQQPVLREYFGEYNNAVTLTTILEKLIDSKSRTDVTSSLDSQTPRPPPRLSRKQSKTCIRVNVGVQKSTPMSTTSCQDQVSYSTTHRLIKKQKSRRSFRRNLKPRVSEIPTETPRPLQVFSGQSIIPVSSIQLATVVQPLSNSSGFSPTLMDTRSSSNYYRNSSGNHGHSIILNNPIVQEANLISVVDSGIKCSSLFSATRGSPSSNRESSFSVKDERLVLREIESLNEDKINRQFVNEQDRIWSLVLEKIEQKRQCARDVSQLHLPHHSTSIQLQESRVAEASADPIPGQRRSKKDRSWWKTKFPLKRKMVALLKCMSKNHTDDGKMYDSQKGVFEKARNENVVPIPPVRVRRKCHAGGAKSRKSIQWELSENVSRCIEKIDSCQVTENQQSNKSTSVNSIIRKATVTSGTNTDVNESHNSNTKLSPKQNWRAPINPEIIQVLEKACTDFSRELSASDRTSVESDVVEAVKEKSEPSFTDDKPSLNDFSLPSKENFESSIVHCQKNERDSSISKKLKVSRSFSSKIPLATKPVSFFDASLTISGRRPSTAPIVENSSSHSLRLDAFLGESEGGKCSGKKCVSQEVGKKALFKHNRSSLLRANNSMSKKSTMGLSHLSRRMITDNYIEKKSFSKALTSPWSIDEDEAPLKTSSVEETPFEKPILEKPLEDNESDTKIKSLPLEVNDFLGTRSMSSTSEHRTEQTVAGKIPSHDFSEVALLKVEDLTHDKEILQPRSHPIDSKQSWNNEAESSLGDGKSIHRNLEHSKNERRSPKASTYSLDVKPCSSHADKDDETPIFDGETQKKGNNESTIGDSMHLKEEEESCNTNSTLCNGMSNVKCEKDEKLPTKVEVSEESSPKSIDFREEIENIESNKICSNSNLCKPQSDMKSFSIENSVGKEQPEGFFACRVKIDEMKMTLQNEETRFQRPLAFSTASKTEEYLFKHPDMNVRKLASRNKDINPLERSRRPCLQSKSIPSSRLSPQLGIGKSSVKSARLLNKNIIPPSMATAKFNSANNRSVKNLSGVSYDAVDDSLNPELETPKSEDADLIVANKTAKTISRVAKSTKKSKQKSTKISKMRNKNIEEIFEVVRQVIDVAINESVSMARKTNLGILSPKQIIPSSSEISSELSVDSLEPIRGQTTSRITPPIGRNIRRATMDGVDEEYYPFCSLKQKKGFGSSCSQKESNICSKKEKLHLIPVKESKKISKIVTNERQDGFRGIQSSKKFLIAKKPSVKNPTSEISALSSIESERDSIDERKFVVERSQTSCGRSDKASYRDNEFETTVVTPKIVTDKNKKELIPFEMEYHLTQSVTTLDLSEIVDEPEKLSPSMLDVYFESSVEFANSRPLQGSTSEKKYKNLKLLDIDRNSIRVTNDENNGKRSRDGRNVKINNKVLEEKVKSSIENGVPLKTITITDPSIIKPNCLNENSQIADKIMRNQDSKQTGSKVPDKPPKKLSNNSRDPSTAVKSEGQCSHTTSDSHRNQDIIVGDKTARETSSKPKHVEIDTTADHPQFNDKKNCAVGQNNLELSSTGLELDKKLTRQRGTLIPRYKNT